VHRVAYCFKINGLSQNFTYVWMFRRRFLAQALLANMQTPTTRCCSLFSLTNRLHVVVRLFRDRRWRQNVVRTKKWHRAVSRVRYMFVPHHWRHLWSITEQTHGSRESQLFYLKPRLKPWNRGTEGYRTRKTLMMNKSEFYNNFFPDIYGYTGRLARWLTRRFLLLSFVPNASRRALSYPATLYSSRA